MEELKELVKASNIEKLREFLSGESKQLLKNQNKKGRTLLHIAVKYSAKNPEKREGLLLVARELIKFGANVNALDYNEAPPLHFAARYRDIKMVECLLKNKAIVNLQDKERFTALHLACLDPAPKFRYPRSLNLKVVKLLLKYRAIPDIRNNEENTPLIIAIQSNYNLNVQELLNNKASTNIRNYYGNTAMYYALTQLDINLYIVHDLFRHGGSFTIPNNRGTTALKCYINKLKKTSPIEMRRAKHVFRLFGLMYHLMEGELPVLNTISLAKEHQLPEYIESCRKEIVKMKKDVLEPNFSVFDLTVRGVFYMYRKTEYRSTSIEVLDKALAKLMEGQYPLYSVWIVEGVYRPYMNERFGVVCSDQKRMRPYFLDYSEFTYFSEYLTNFDMLNMMIACRNASPSESPSAQSENCSIS